MTDYAALLDLRPWKPVLTALLLPPVPLLLAILWGGRLLSRQRRVGWLLVLPSLAALWLGNCNGAAQALARGLDLQPPALTTEKRRAVADGVALDRPGGTRFAIVVLGGGREAWAPEYRASSLSPESMQRLRYGLWLARATGAPLAFSGGLGWGQQHGEAEADIAARIAAEEHGHPLRWIENRSRDTRENARNTLPMLRMDGVKQVLLVTHGGHMRRALRAFRAAAGDAIVIDAAPMGLSEGDDNPVLEWMPSGRGGLRLREVLREWVGLMLGA